MMVSNNGIAKPIAKPLETAKNPLSGSELNIAIVETINPME
jgi:hypothetical protein